MRCRSFTEPLPLPLPTYYLEPLEPLGGYVHNHPDPTAVSLLIELTIEISTCSVRKWFIHRPRFDTSDAFLTFNAARLLDRWPQGGPAFVSRNWHNRLASLILLGPDRDLSISIIHVLFLLVLVSLDGYIYFQRVLATVDARRAWWRPTICLDLLAFDASFRLDSLQAVKSYRNSGWIHLL